MKSSRLVLDAVRQEGTTHVFLVPGSLIGPYLAEFDAELGLTPIVAAHEAGAAFMADGYARASGRFGTCMTIGGPGLANMVPAVAAAYADRSPILVLTGEVPTDWEGLGAFQDASPAAINGLALLSGITSSARQVPSPALVAHHLHVALRGMLGIARRPACIAIPRQILVANAEREYRPIDRCATHSPRLRDSDAIDRVAAKLATTRRIAILAGNGAGQARATDDLCAFIETHRIPTATTLRAKGVVPEDHPCSLGVFGYAGSRHSAEALLGGEVGVLLVLGSSLNQRNTMIWSRRLHPRCKLIQVDIDPTNFGRHFPADLTVTSDVREFIRGLAAHPTLSAALAGTAGERVAWMTSIRKVPRHYDEETRTSDQIPIHPARVVVELRRAAPRETVLLVDSGAHRAFAGHHWTSYGPDQYLSSTTLAPMGWAVPAAIGAKLARPELPCAVVTGDGCMLMHGIEIQTAARYRVPVVFVVINNQAHGAVYLGARSNPVSRETAILENRDWCMFARSLGVEAERVDRPEQLGETFAQAFAKDRPILVEVICDRDCATPITPWSKAKEEWMDEH